MGPSDSDTTDTMTAGLGSDGAVEERTISFEPMEIGYEEESLLNEGAEDSSSVRANASAMKANIFRVDSIAIPVFYFTLGLLMKLPYLPLRIFLRDHIHATPGQQALVFAVVMGMPWNLKVFIGFLSDTTPIRGQRRKPYMFLGTAVCSSCWMLMGMWGPGVTMGLLVLFLFFGVLGMIIGDVMADALVVERVKHEVKKGSIQTSVWMLRFSGGIVGFLASGRLMEYGNVHPQTIFFITGLVPLLTLLPSVYLLHDERIVVRGTQKEQMTEKMYILWDTLQTKNIWMPMLFLYSFASTPNAGDAFSNFLLGPLGFTESEYSYLLTVGMLSQLVGAYIYKRWLGEIGWHKLFLVTLVTGSALSATQLILVARLNVQWGIPDMVFAFGDEIVNDVVAFILQMPTLIMCAALCPKGIEGVLYALMVCVNNVALSTGGAISGAITDALGITSTNFDGLFTLVLITSLSSLLPILLIPFTPKSAKECEEAALLMERTATDGGTSLARPRRNSGDKSLIEEADRATPRDALQELKRSKLGGGAVVFALVVGFIFSIADTAWKLSLVDED